MKSQTASEIITYDFMLISLSAVNSHGVNFTRPKVTMAPADLLDRSRGARGDFFTESDRSFRRRARPVVRATGSAAIFP